MKQVYLRGYINWDSKDYTFNYENNRLTLIQVESTQTFFSEYKYVDYFEGFTVNGFDVIFFINSDIYYKDGCFICSPRCVLISQNQNYKLSEMKFDSFRMCGNVLNRFYSNHRLIQFEKEKYEKVENEYFSFKDISEATSAESVTVNDINTIFELSIIKPGWQDDGSITFGNYDTMLRVKFDSVRDYKEVVKVLGEIETFFRFCLSRNAVSFDSIYIENKNEQNEYYKTVEIFIPYMLENKFNKEMLTYDLFEGHLTEIFKCLKESDYVFSIIPDNNEEFENISNKDYCAMFSCFQSIYQYTQNNKIDELTEKEKKLEEVKKEIIPILSEIEQSYKGIDAVKRNYIKRFIHIIDVANMKLEKCIANEIDENGYVIDTLYYKLRDEINQKGIENSISEAINNRDDITHNRTVNLSMTSIGIYKIISKLNYIMLLKYIGVENKKIENMVKRLSIRDVL